MPIISISYQKFQAEIPYIPWLDNSYAYYIYISYQKFQAEIPHLTGLDSCYCSCVYPIRNAKKYT